jgi:hypothetical protein
MFIDSVVELVRPPSGGPCADQLTRFRRRQSYIALLAEGRVIAPGVYKPGPPDGGPPDSSEISSRKSEALRQEGHVSNHQ